MSDYPRPPAPSPPPLFVFDRVVGGICLLYFSGTTLWWLASVLSSPDGQTYYLQKNPVYLPLYVAFVSVFMWGSLLVYRGRQAGFAVFTLLLGFILVAAFFFGRLASSFPYFLVWIYCVTRLFRVLGPKPGR